MGVFSATLRMSKRLPSKIPLLVNNYNCAYFRFNIPHCRLAVISALKLCICNSKGLCNNINLVINTLRCRGTPFNARMNSVFGLPSSLPRLSVPLFFRHNGVPVPSDTFHSRNAGGLSELFPYLLRSLCNLQRFHTISLRKFRQPRRLRLAAACRRRIRFRREAIELVPSSV